METSGAIKHLHDCICNHPQTLQREFVKKKKSSDFRKNLLDLWGGSFNHRGHIAKCFHQFFELRCQLFHFLLGSVIVNAFHSSNVVNSSNLFPLQLNFPIVGLLKINLCSSVCAWVLLLASWCFHPCWVLWNLLLLLAPSLSVWIWLSAVTIKSSMT